MRRKDREVSDSRVCFTIFNEGKPLYAEKPCNSGYYFSSIIGNGVVEFIEKSSDKQYALSKMFEHQSGRKEEFTEAQADSVGAFKIVSRDYTGKQKPMPGN